MCFVLVQMQGQRVGQRSCRCRRVLDESAGHFLIDLRMIQPMIFRNLRLHYTCYDPHHFSRSVASLSPASLLSMWSEKVRGCSRDGERGADL